MPVFSEIHGAYFRTAERILAQEHITDKEISRIIGEEAFRDSMLFLPQKFRPGSGEDWGFLTPRREGGYARITRHAPPGFVTMLQKRWLCAKLADPKMRLFLDDETMERLEAYLRDIPPLYPPGAFHCFDVFKDGDDYASAHYRRVFRTMLQAVKSGEIVEMDYLSGKGVPVRGRFGVLRLQYSRKNDKFRAYCCRIPEQGRPDGTGLVNLGRIRSVRPTGEQRDTGITLEKCLRSRRCKTPVQVEVRSERNGIERFMMEFASFEKRTERDPATGKCRVWLWYDTQDETELLIRLLGFGPVVEILGPEHFRKQAAERVARQYALLFHT